MGAVRGTVLLTSDGCRGSGALLSGVWSGEAGARQHAADSSSQVVQIEPSRLRVCHTRRHWAHCTGLNTCAALPKSESQLAGSTQAAEPGLRDPPSASPSPAADSSAMSPSSRLGLIAQARCHSEAHRVERGQCKLIAQGVQLLVDSRQLELRWCDHRQVSCKWSLRLDLRHTGC